MCLNPVSIARRRLAAVRGGRGFTLVELMIVVAIIGLLAGIGVPGYLDYVRKGKRAEGKAALLAASSRLERYYTQKNCYPSNTVGCGSADTSAKALTEAGIVDFSGENSGKASYDMILTVNPQDFVITAQPKLPFVDTKCGRFTLTNTGRKWTQSNGSTDDSGKPVDGCW